MSFPSMSPALFTWVVVPLLIFVARIFDVTLGTLRIIFVSRGRKWLAPLCGFVEVIIWLVAISQVMQNLTNVACYLAYGAGFALGNFIGISIEERLAVGFLVVRIVTAKDSAKLVEALVAANYGVTCVEGRGANGPVKLIYTVIKRKDLAEVADLIERFDPQAFYSTEDARSTNKGVFPSKESRRFRIPRLFEHLGK